jgi:hypothetical protein
VDLLDNPAYPHSNYFDGLIKAFHFSTVNNTNDISQSNSKPLLA